MLAGAAAGALGAAASTSFVDRLFETPQRTAKDYRTEQHALGGLEVIEDNGVEVVVPPLHHQVVTAKLRVGDDAASLGEARAELERALQRLEEEFGRHAGPARPSRGDCPIAGTSVRPERLLPVDVRASVTAHRAPVQDHEVARCHRGDARPDRPTAPAAS